MFVLNTKINHLGQDLYSKLFIIFSTKLIVGDSVTAKLVLATSVELEKHAAEMVGRIKVQKENALELRLHAMDITVAHRLRR